MYTFTSCAHPFANIQAVRIGYGRVSTRDQRPEAQDDALAGAGYATVFIDKASGKLAHRPEVNNALNAARGGSQLVVTKLDRLGRSLEHLIEPSNSLQRRGVDLVVLDHRIDPAPPSAGCSPKYSDPSPGSNTS